MKDLQDSKKSGVLKAIKSWNRQSYYNRIIFGDFIMILAGGMADIYFYVMSS